MSPEPREKEGMMIDKTTPACGFPMVFGRHGR